jgi:hypothetical protein
VLDRSRGVLLRTAPVTSRLAGWARSLVPLALVVACVGGVNVLWLIRFRFEQVTGWDESGYIAIAIRDTRALHEGGLASLAGEFERQNVQAPLLPLLTVPINAVFGNGVFQSLIALQIVAAALTVATFLLARTLMSRGWSLLAAACVGSTPAIADYGREYVFPIPAALFLTAATWMLIRSDQLRKRRWVVGSGGLVGLMLLSRTMTVSFLPALLAAGLSLLVASRSDDRRRRFRSLIWAGVATFAVAGTWYLRNGISVAAYLLHYGYGKQSGTFGTAHPASSWAFWAKDVRLAAQSLYLPLAVLIVVAIVVAVAECVRSRTSPRSWLGTPTLAVATVPVVGYLTLASSTNEGTGFVLPLLPPLTVVAVASASRLRHRLARRGFVLLFVIVCIGNVAMKSSLIRTLGKPVAVRVPGIGSVPVIDGRGLIQDEVGASGYATGSATAPLSAVHKRWLPLMQTVTTFADRFARDRGQTPYVLFGSDDQIFNTTRADLANALSGNNAARSSFIEPDPDGDRISYYRSRLNYLKPNFIEVAQRPPTGAAQITPQYVVSAARALHYRRVYEFTLPDGRHASLWYRQQRSLAIGTPPWNDSGS